MSSAAETEIATEGDVTATYALWGLVDLSTGRTLSIPIVDATIDAERVSMFQHQSGGKHPVAALMRENTKSVSLPPGILTVYDERFKSMKRHLATKFGITPDDYRARWGLLSDYPMVAAGYSEKRSALALSLGLGRNKADPVAEKAGSGRKATNTQAKAA